MPQAQIDVGFIDPTNANGDFFYKQNQVQFVRTTDATLTPLTIVDFTTPVPVLAATVVVNVVVTARTLSTVLVSTGTTLTNDVEAFVDSFEYTGADPPFLLGESIVIDDEWIAIGAVDSGTNTLSLLTRGVTPSPHTAGTTLYYPSGSGTEISAHWGKSAIIHIDPDPLTLNANQIGVAQPMFPTVKNQSAIDWSVEFAEIMGDTQIEVDLTGAAATTIDWVIHSSISAYYDLLP